MDIINRKRANLKSKNGSKLGTLHKLKNRDKLKAERKKYVFITKKPVNSKTSNLKLQHKLNLQNMKVFLIFQFSEILF